MESVVATVENECGIGFQAEIDKTSQFELPGHLRKSQFEKTEKGFQF